jgi:hypothetical protein
MVNVAPVELPARSVTMNALIPSVEITSQLLYVVPFKVAHERFVSLNVID